MRVLVLLPFLLLCPVALYAQQPSGDSVTVQRVWTLDATYTDTAHGVSFRYPAVWSASSQWGYHPPAISVGDNRKPTAGFGYKIGGFPDSGRRAPYVHSNLEGFGITYLAEPQPNAAACERQAAMLVYEDPLKVQPRKEKIAGITYSVRDYGEGGMSQSTGGPVYSTYRNKTCYFFELAVSISSGAVDSDPTEWPAIDVKDIERRLHTIMQTVRFVR